jgi:8-oxo-dGTP diphosphatase
MSKDPFNTNAERIHPERPFLGVGAVIVRGDEVVLVQRGNEPWRGWWSLPGGVVETGEHLKDAVRREMWEETGFQVRPIDVVEIFESIRPAEDGRVAYHYVVIDYVCEVEAGELRAADDALAARWFRRDQLPENITPGAAEVIEKAFTGLGQR